MSLKELDALEVHRLPSGFYSNVRQMTVTPHLIWYKLEDGRIFASRHTDLYSCGTKKAQRKLYAQIAGVEFKDLENRIRRARRIAEKENEKERVEEIRAMAKAHGFDLTPLTTKPE